MTGHDDKFVQVECDNCGNDQFYVYEAADGEQRIVCEACGCVAGVR